MHVIDQLCALGLPDEWCRIEMDSGTAFAAEDDLRAAGGDIANAELSLWVGIHDVVDDTAFVERIMRRRVPQGRPDRFDATVGGRTGRGFLWTDGVGEICSIFFEVTPTRCVELQLARPAFRKHPRALEDVAADLLANACWLDNTGRG